MTDVKDFWLRMPTCYSIHYDEIVHNNEDLMVVRIICMQLIIVIQQYVHIMTAFTMYSIELIMPFWSHSVSNDLHKISPITNVYVCVYLCIYMWVYKCVNTYVWMCVYMYMCVYVCMCANVCVCACICVCVCKWVNV